MFKRDRIDWKWVGGLAAVATAAIIAVGVAASVASPSDSAKKEHSKGKAGGYLGVYMQELSDDLRKGLEVEVKQGVIVSGVEEDSPADEAGLEDGDVIVRFDGKEVESPEGLRDIVRETEVGRKVDVVVVRGSDKKTLALVVGERPDPGEFTWFDAGDLKEGIQSLGTWYEGWPWGPRLGVEVTELSEDLASYFGTGAGDGVLVLKVREESPAADAGIKPGDVIKKVGDEAISSAEDLRETVRGEKAGEKVEVAVLRKGKAQTFQVELEESPSFAHFESDTPHAQKIVVAPKGGHRELIIKNETGDEELRREVKELKEELKQLKEELKKLEKR